MAWSRSFPVLRCVVSHSRLQSLPLQPDRPTEASRWPSQPDEIETPEVIMSATKTQIPVKEVTSAVEVITGEQMQQRKVRTVAEALRWAQGLVRIQSGGPGTTSTCGCGGDARTDTRLDRWGDR